MKKVHFRHGLICPISILFSRKRTNLTIPIMNNTILLKFSISNRTNFLLVSLDDSRDIVMTAGAAGGRFITGECFSSFWGGP